MLEICWSVVAVITEAVTVAPDCPRITTGFDAIPVPIPVDLALSTDANDEPLAPPVEIKGAPFAQLTPAYPFVI